MLNNKKAVLGFLSNVCAMLYTGKIFSPAVFPVGGWWGSKIFLHPSPPQNMVHLPTHAQGDNGQGLPSPPTYLHPDRRPCSCPAPSPPPRHTHLPARLYLYTTRGRERPQNAAGAHAVHTTALHLPDRRSAQSATQRPREQEITVYSSMPGTSNLYSPGTWRKSRKQRLRPYRLDSVEVSHTLQASPSKTETSFSKFQANRKQEGSVYFHPCNVVQALQRQALEDTTHGGPADRPRNNRKGRPGASVLEGPTLAGAATRPPEKMKG